MQCYRPSITTEGVCKTSTLNRVGFWHRPPRPVSKGDKFQGGNAMHFSTFFSSFSLVFSRKGGQNSSLSKGSKKARAGPRVGYFFSNVPRSPQQHLSLKNKYLAFHCFTHICVHVCIVCSVCRHTLPVSINFVVAQNKQMFTYSFLLPVKSVCCFVCLALQAYTVIHTAMKS